MKKPNYNMERKDRERAKQAKATAKLESRAVKRDESSQPDVPPMDDQVDLGETRKQKPDD